MKPNAGRAPLAFYARPKCGTLCRARALTFLVGVGVLHFQTLGIPVALTAVAFIVGLLLLPFGVETKGKPLPA